MISTYDSLMKQIADNKGIGCCTQMQLEEVDLDEGHFHCLSCHADITLEAEWEISPPSHPKVTPKTLTEIELLEKSLNVRIVKVLQADKNGRNRYHTKILLATLDTGEISTLETSLSLESLQQLGYTPSPPWNPRAKEKFDSQQAKIFASHPPSWEEVVDDMIKEKARERESEKAREQAPQSLENPLDFILAGRAIFTVQNEKTGNRFTFKVVAHEKDPVHFVHLLTGRKDNITDSWWTGDYEYLGTIHHRGGYFPGKTSRVSVEAPSQKAFIWLWDRLKKGNLPPQIQIYHQGKCGRCGAKLTVPESIKTGLGPECAKKVREDRKVEPKEDSEKTTRTGESETGRKRDRETFEADISPESPEIKEVIIESVNRNIFRLAKPGGNGFAGETLQSGFASEAKAKAFALKEYPGAEIVTMTRL